MGDKRKLFSILFTFLLEFIDVTASGNAFLACANQKELASHEKAFWTPIPNLGAALKGYNPFIADRFVSRGTDPGFRYQIFESTYIDEEGTASIYSNIRADKDIACSDDSTAEVARNYQDLMKERSSQWDSSETRTRSSSKKIPFFSLLVNYERHQTEITKKDRYSSSNKKVNFFEETQGEVYINEDLCQVYRVDIDPVKPTFTGGFIAGTFSFLWF